MQQERQTDYLDSFQLAQKLNFGVPGKLQTHGMPQKLAKLQGMDVDHT